MRPSCSRCSARQTSCYYASFVDAAPTLDDGSIDNSTLQHEAISGAGGVSFGTANAYQTSESLLATLDAFDSAAANLSTIFCPENGIFDVSLGSSLNIFESFDGSIPNSQLNIIRARQNQTALSNLPPAATAPQLVNHSMEYIFRILRTWPRIMAKGIQLPPMIHPSQSPAVTKSKWLLNCYTIVKMWYGQCLGTSEIVQETVKKEMHEIMSAYQSFDETNVLAALQALSIYLLLLLFPSNDQSSLPILEEDLFRQIRQIVYHVASSGLVLAEERTNVRPTWEAWLHITTKRRAVLTLYLVHWSYSVYHSLPSFDCKDLGSMPAPSAKYLWQASERKQWETLYNRWLAQWDGNEYYQWEFFEIPPGVRMTERAEMWLEDADEFGMIFIAIANAWEREPEFEIIHL